MRKVPAPQMTTDISDLASKKVMDRMRILLFAAFQAVLTVAWATVARWPDDFSKSLFGLPWHRRKWRRARALDTAQPRHEE